MPAPPAALVTALRTGAADRHIFFSMTHVDGAVRCWDGIGDFQLGADVHLGVGGLMQLEGISDSGDVQNHSVSVKLNGATLPSINVTTLSIRGEAASLVFGWIDEAGTVAASRIVFSGLGDVLRTRFTVEEKSVTAILRAPLAEWQTPPRAYYTDADQQRRYSDDTGFSFVRLLENVSVSGWSKDVENAGGVPTLALNYSTFRDSVSSEVLGFDTWGAPVRVFQATPPYVGSWGATTVVEETTGAAVTSAGPAAPVASAGTGAGSTMQVGGINCYIDIAGAVRSAGGKKVFPTGVSAQFIRKQATISTAGSATADTVTAATYTVGASTITYFRKTSGSYTYPNNDRSAIVYDNSGLLSATSDSTSSTSGTARVGSASTSTPWVEETTGNAVTYSSGLLKCNGANCVVSTTGAIITNTGKKIIPQGSTNAKQFLRVWT